MKRRGKGESFVKVRGSYSKQVVRWEMGNPFMAFFSSFEDKSS